jgi:hypothetical protein
MEILAVLFNDVGVVFGNGVVHYPETKGLTLEELARLFEEDETVGIVEKLDSIKPEPEAAFANVDMYEGVE